MPLFENPLQSPSNSSNVAIPPSVWAQSRGKPSPGQPLSVPVESPSCTQVGTSRRNTISVSEFVVTGGLPDFISNTPTVQSSRIPLVLFATLDNNSLSIWASTQDPQTALLKHNPHTTPLPFRNSHNHPLPFPIPRINSQTRIKPRLQHGQRKAFNTSHKTGAQRYPQNSAKTQDDLLRESRSLLLLCDKMSARSPLSTAWSVSLNLQF